MPAGYTRTRKEVEEIVNNLGYKLLDEYIVKLNIGRFVIQDKYKFEDSKYRDKLKKEFARKNGVYIEIDLRKIKTIEKAIEYFIEQPYIKKGKL